MDELTHNKMFLLVSFVVCFGIAWLIQNSLIFNSDASWLMLATKRLLAGGNYTHDFFEINPPMILYVYSPAALFVKITNLPTYIILRTYVFLLIAFSLLICTNLSLQIFKHDHKFLRNSFLIAIAIILLWLPMTEFGQREHLMVIFTLPYFLLMAARHTNPGAQKNSFAFALGVFAGCGFAIKPFFLAPLLFTEIFYYRRKPAATRSFLRPEIFGMVSIFFLFGALLLIFNNDYLSIVVPAVAHIYYQKYGLPMQAMLLNEQSVFAYFAIAFYFMRYRYHKQQNLATILMLMVTGFLLVFLMQQTSWYYHVLPLLMTSSLLFFLLFGLLVLQKNISTAEYISLSIFTGLLAGYLVFHLRYISESLLNFPVTFFALFALLFSFLLTAAQARKNKIIFLLPCLLLAATGFYKYLLHSPLVVHVFFLTSTLLVLLFALLVPDRTTNYKLKYIQFALMGMVIFAIPFYQGGYVYNYAQAYKKLYGNLLTMMNQYPRKSVFFFSNVADFGFPALDYTRQTLASRFPAFAWVPALSFWDDQQIYAMTYTRQAASMNFYIAAVVDDFNKHKPDVVFIDARNTSADNRKTYFGSQQIDYLRFFSLNNGFNEVWQHYHYVKTVDGQPLFKFNIYERNPSV